MKSFNRDIFCEFLSGIFYNQLYKSIMSKRGVLCVGATTPAGEITRRVEI